MVTKQLMSCCVGTKFRFLKRKEVWSLLCDPMKRVNGVVHVAVFSPNIGIKLSLTYVPWDRVVEVLPD